MCLNKNKIYCINLCLLGINSYPMVNYNPKRWLKAIFQFHKADTFRALIPLLIIIFLYSLGIVYAAKHFSTLVQSPFVRNITVMHTLLGFAISMLLVFRTNTAYDRWWEGRKLWGTLVNNSRNLAIKINTFLPVEDKASRKFFAQAISLYAMLLKRHLQKESTRLELDEQPHPELPDFNTAIHPPINLAQAIINKINQLYKKEEITAEQFIILNSEMQSFMDVCGPCERIKNTPIPFSYSAFIKKFIFIYVITLPFGFAFTLGYLAVPVTTFIFYVLASLELVAEEIEDPFGNDSNDLPIEKIAEMIKKNVEDILK